MFKCLFYYLCGRSKRKLIGKAKLGFHTTFTRIDDLRKKKLVEGYDERLDYENIAYFQRLASVEEIVFFQTQGIDMYFVLRVLQVHPLDMWYPKREELNKYGVIN